MSKNLHPGNKASKESKITLKGSLIDNLKNNITSKKEFITFLQKNIQFESEENIYTIKEITEKGIVLTTRKEKETIKESEIKQNFNPDNLREYYQS